MHRRLTECYGSAWYDNPATGLDTACRDRLADAKTEAARTGQAPGPPRIVAGLSFRFLDFVARSRRSPRSDWSEGELRDDTLEASAASGVPAPQSLDAQAGPSTAQRFAQAAKSDRPSRANLREGPAWRSPAHSRCDRVDFARSTNVDRGPQSCRHLARRLELREGRFLLRVATLTSRRVRRCVSSRRGTDQSRGAGLDRTVSWTILKGADTVRVGGERVDWIEGRPPEGRRTQTRGRARVRDHRGGHPARSRPVLAPGGRAGGRLDHVGPDQRVRVTALPAGSPWDLDFGGSRMRSARAAATRLTASARA